ncbi:MAG: hypothetical protein V1792_14195 [Pseudomonadota bacterium]
MGKIPGIDHLAAARALQRAGFRIVRQGKHIVMSDGSRILILKDEGLSVDDYLSWR